MPPYLMVRCTSATMEPMYLIGAFLSFFLATNSVMAGKKDKKAPMRYIGSMVADVHRTIKYGGEKLSTSLATI